jgi:hypothetical protein
MARVAHDEITVSEGNIVGPLRRSVNQAQGVRGSIHDDATATKLGFRGGTVAGSIHLELFPPLLLEAFGSRWFERGSLSMNFRNATTDREAVRAKVARPPAEAKDAQVTATVEREDGMLVAEGTASVGDPDAQSALLQLDVSRYESSDLKILAGLQRGDEIPAAEVAMPSEVQTSRLDVITEPLEWYRGDSPWGGPVASPATIVHFLYAHPARVIGRNAGKAVGLFGAIEVRHVNGPLVLDETYRIGGEIVAVGESPKTEYVWFESHADTIDGKRVAEMRMQLRWMKASSPLYTGS